MSRSHCMMKEFQGKTEDMLQLLARQVESQMERMEELNHKFDKIQSALEKMTGGNWADTNSVATPIAKRLCLMFLNEVSNEVLTGKEIRGKGGNPVRLAIVDETGQVVKSGPGSSAKVEILLLEANAAGNGNNRSDEDFKTGEVKPHFAKTYHVFLEGGIGDLSNAKFAHESKWTRSCMCQLGARVVENLSGIEVQEACSESFMVQDSRSKLYDKHYPPSLLDPVWRLVNIGRGGEPCKRLTKKNVLTVKDLLFLNSVDPQRLHEIIRAGDNALKAIKAHAQTCIIDDTSIGVYSSSEHNISVVFDVVGDLKGIIHDSRYVLKSCLSEDQKALACELLCSAFGDQKSITFHKDEKTLMQQFPCQPSNAFWSIQESVLGCTPAIPANTNHFYPTKPSTSFQSICPSGEPSGNTNNTLRCQDPDQTSYVAMNVSIQDSYPAGGNSTIDTAQQAEAPEYFPSAYQPWEEVNSKGENGLHWDDICQPDAITDDMLQRFFEDLVPSSPVVDGTDSQFHSPELQPNGPMSMPNSDQDQRARTRSGGGEPVLNSTGNSRRGILESTWNSLNGNRPMKRSKTQQTARNASSPGQQQAEARSQLRSRSRSRGPRIRTADLGREGCGSGHGRGCCHDSRGRGGGGRHGPVLSHIACRGRRNKN